ncbi:Ig-like domain-containing protein [soil metagenome]
MSVRLPARRLGVASVAALSCFALAACNASSADPGSSAEGQNGSSATPGGSSQGGDSSSPDDAVDSVTKPTVSTNVRKGATGVPVSTLVEVSATDGALTSVKVSSSAGQLAGSLSSDGASWTAQDRLEPDTTYTVKATAAGSQEGSTSRKVSRFTTEALTLAQQTYPSVAPLAGETVGVGMPVIVTFDLPVTNEAAFEKQMSVTSVPKQAGAWHWLSNTEAHWRPKNYWKAGTQVSVDVGVNGVDAGNGIYGQEDRTVDFEVGDTHIYRVDAQTHQMKVFSNGKLLRTIPITTGKPGFVTRSGTKVIIEKFESKRMNSETVGITGSEAYDLDDVKYAMRLTYSGEFIHAAPWSVGSQGYANVSHGCTGMSTDQAAWLYAMTRRGDVVEYTGTDRPMEFTNGYGDWNENFAQYAKGSAL